jgi:F-type H+-transporting ATPase subunit epsilon
LADSSERRKDIDLNRAKTAQERAEKRLEEAPTREDIDANRAKAALERAVVRINLAELR